MVIVMEMEAGMDMVIVMEVGEDMVIVMEMEAGMDMVIVMEVGMDMVIVTDMEVGMDMAKTIMKKVRKILVMSKLIMVQLQRGHVLINVGPFQYNITVISYLNHVLFSNFINSCVYCVPIANAFTTFFVSFSPRCRKLNED